MKKLERRDESQGEAGEAGQTFRPAQAAISPQMCSCLHLWHVSAGFLCGQ